MTEIICGNKNCVYNIDKKCGQDMIELEETDGSDGYVNCALCTIMRPEEVEVYEKRKENEK